MGTGGGVRGQGRMMSGSAGSGHMPGKAPAARLRGETPSVPAPWLAKAGESASALVARLADRLRADGDSWRHASEVLRFSPEVIADLSLGLFVGEDGRRWLVYPYRLGGRWTSAVGRSIDGGKAFFRAALPGGFEPPPVRGMPHTYRIDALAEGGSAIVTEGERDTAAALTMGLEAPGRVAVVSLRADPRPFQGQRGVWVAYDSDAAGDEAAQLVVAPWMRALRVPCYRVRLARHKDLGDALAELGPAGGRAEVLEAIGRAELLR